MIEFKYIQVDKHFSRNLGRNLRSRNLGEKNEKGAFISLKFLGATFYVVNYLIRKLLGKVELLIL